MNTVNPYHLIFLLLNFVSLFCCAQKKSSVLWKISGNGLQHESYLFGTIHSVPYDVIKKFPVLEEVIKKSEIGLFEIAESGTYSYDPALEAQAFPPLDSVFTKEEYALVDSFFIAAGYGSIKEHNNDASLTGMIQVAILVKESSSSSTDMLFENWIEKSMIESNKPTIQLDDPNMRARHEIERITPRKLADFLVKYISGLSISTILDKTVDINGYMSTMTYDFLLNKKLSSNNPFIQAYRKAEERNLFWLPKIEEQLKKGTCLIAVGAWHLRYNTGLIVLLKKAGYTLSPVKLESI